MDNPYDLGQILYHAEVCGGRVVYRKGEITRLTSCGARLLPERSMQDVWVSGGSRKWYVTKEASLGALRVRSYHRIWFCKHRLAQARVAHRAAGGTAEPVYMDDFEGLDL